MWKYTPRQVAAWNELGSRRLQGDLAALIGVYAIGSSGDKKAFNKAIGTLSNEAS